MNVQSSVITAVPARPTVRGHLLIMRADHWFKNVFVLPGVIAAAGVNAIDSREGLIGRFVIGMISICLVASSTSLIT